MGQNHKNENSCFTGYSRISASVHEIVPLRAIHRTACLCLRLDGNTLRSPSRLVFMSQCARASLMETSGRGMLCNILNIAKNDISSKYMLRPHPQKYFHGV